MLLSSYFMSKFYNASLQKMETASLADWRRDLLGDVSGDVLEIGCGTGVKPQYYSDQAAVLQR